MVGDVSDMASLLQLSGGMPNAYDIPDPHAKPNMRVWENLSGMVCGKEVFYM
jgi:hypothetical protein